MTGPVAGPAQDPKPRKAGVRIRLLALRIEQDQEPEDHRPRLVTSSLPRNARWDGREPSIRGPISSQFQGESESESSSESPEKRAIPRVMIIPRRIQPIAAPA